MKTILFKELSDNYKILNPLVPSDNKFHPSLVQVPCLSGLGISTAFYEAYLSRLAELKSADTHNIIDSYVLLQHYKKACKDFLDLKPDDLDVQKSIEAKMRVQGFLQLMINTYSKTEKALGAFKNGEKFVMEETQNRGCEYSHLVAQLEIQKNREFFN